MDTRGATAKGPDKLTAKQEKFCQAIVAGNTQADAYRAAYDAKRMKAETIQRNACELMKDNKVAARVEELRKPVVAKVVKKLELSKEWVLAQLVEVVEMGKAVDAVTDADGNPIGEFKVANLPAANKALELIGKELEMFVERKEIRHGSMDGLTHEEKVSALDLVQAEMQKRRANGPINAVH